MMAVSEDEDSRGSEEMELPTRILAIRHGETDWNVQTRIQGQLDIPLNATGRWQARQLTHAVAGEEITTVYSSDLQRALETARCVVRGAGLDGLVSDTGLRERAFGAFEGHTYREIETQWPAASMRWRQRDPDFGAEGGETLRGFYQRCVATVSRLASKHPGETIAIVAHGGVLDCLYRAAARAELQATRTWQLRNAAVNRLLYTAQGLILVGWSDTVHLDDAPMTPDGAEVDARHLDRVGPAA